MSRGVCESPDRGRKVTIVNSDALASQNANVQEAQTEGDAFGFDDIELPTDGFDSLDQLGATGSGGGGTNRKVRISDPDVPLTPKAIVDAYGESTDCVPNIAAKMSELKTDDERREWLRENIQGQPLFCLEIAAQYLRNPHSSTYSGLKYWKIGYITGRVKNGRIEMLVREFSIGSFQASTAPKSRMYRTFVTNDKYLKYFRALGTFASISESAYGDVQSLVTPSSKEEFKDWVLGSAVQDEYYITA